MARKSLSSNETKRSNNSFRDKVLNLGSSEFNRIFPTLGKMIAAKNTDSNNNTNEPTAADAKVRTHSVYREILENQDRQNVVLKQILGEIKSNDNSNNKPNLLEDLLSSLLPDFIHNQERKNPRGTRNPQTVPDTGKKSTKPSPRPSRPAPPVEVRQPPSSEVRTNPAPPGNAPRINNPEVIANPAPPATTQPRRVLGPGIEPTISIPRILNTPPTSELSEIIQSPRSPLLPGAPTSAPLPLDAFLGQPPRPAVPARIAPGAPPSPVLTDDLISRARQLWNDTITRDAVRIPAAPDGRTLGLIPSDERITSRDRLIRQGQSEFDAAIRSNKVAENARLQSLIDIPPRPSDAQRIQGIPPTPTSPATSGPRNFFQDQIRTPLSQRQQELVRGPRQPLVGPRPQPNLSFGLRNTAIITTALTGLTGGSVQDILTNVGILSGIVLADNVVRYMGRALGNFFLSKVPIIGLLARVYFATQRARAEDYIGAFLELGSGVVSLIPVIGTVGSIAIDIVTIVRDIINHFAPNLRDLIISPEKQAEIEEFLKPLVLAAIGNLINNSPEPELSSSNTQLVQNGDLLELYNAARVDSTEGHALYNFIGAETMVGLEQLFKSSAQGNGLLQRNTIPRARETVLRGLQTRQGLLSRRSGSSAPQQSNKDVQGKETVADLIEDQEYEKIIFDADSIKFEGLVDAVRNTSFNGGEFGGSDLVSMIRGGDISGLGAGIFRGTPRQADNRSRDERAAIAMSFFISKGWTPEQAAGIVGNLVHESGLNTTIVGDRTNPRGPSYGIAQWREGRLTSFQAWSGGRHVVETSLEDQLEFVQYELMNTHKGAGQSLRGANTIEDAVLRIRRQYEVPAEWAANDPSRLAFARRFLAANQNQPQAQPQQTQTNSAPLTGPGLSQAGTNMVAADQQRVRAIQELINNISQIRIPEQTPISSPSNGPRAQISPAEISLRNRLESALSYRPISR